jgi:hypothetical protein
MCNASICVDFLAPTATYFYGSGYKQVNSAVLTSKPKGDPVHQQFISKGEVMSVRNGLVLLLALSAFLFLAACGGSSNHTSTPPPSGGFANSNLNGTYVFSFSGTDAANGTFFAMAGTFATNGSGSITSGNVDIVDPAYGALLSQTLGSGSGYSITSDGRGRGSFVTSGAAGTIGFDFVLTSGSHGLITRFDNNGTGSGTLDLQNSSVTQGGLGSYAFSLSGVDSTFVNPFAAVGNFTLSSTGTITAGLEDFNDDRNSTGLTGLSLSGSVPLGSAAAPGKATLTAAGSPYGTQFDVWAIDATHLKLIETDGLEITVGDAFTQQNTIAAGQLVYTMAGFDSANSLLSEGGYMTYDGSSSISNGLEDINDSGSIAQSVTVSGTLTAGAAGTGRYQLVIGGFYNGVNGGTGTYTFTAYPSSSGILLLETDGQGISSGAAFPQNATTFASGQGYGLNLSGANAGGEVDAIAEFTANSGGTLSNGLIDENDQGILNFDQQLGPNGTYTFDSGATGRGVISYPATHVTSIGTLNLAFYVANSSTILFIDGDGAQVGVGVLAPQGSAAASAALAHTSSHFAALQAAAQHARKKK